MKQPTWKTRDNRAIKISKMDLAHLANTIRMVAGLLEKARASGDRERTEQHERDLFDLQAEFDSRDKEIEQIQGIARALLKPR